MAVHRDHMRILAVASGGGHWVQLLRLKPAFTEVEVVFVSVMASYQRQVPDHKFYRVNDATRWDKVGLIRTALQILRIIWKERPDVVVSTGAAPGYLAVRLGKLLGARTIWLDSIANVEHISMSGSLVKPYADLWLTQWSHLEQPEGPLFRGSVL